MAKTSLSDQLTEAQEELKDYQGYVERCTSSMLGALEGVAEQRFDSYCEIERDDDSLGALGLGVNMMISDIGEAFRHADENRKTLARIIESIPDPVFTVDADLRITYFNPAAAELTGREPHKAIGFPCKSVFGLAMCDEGCPIKRSMKERGVAREEIHVTAASGEELDVIVTASAINGDDGRLIGGIEILRDVTESRAREEELKRLKDELLHTIQQQSHAIQELSTPIIPIMERILVMPLVGVVDTQRARDIMRSLLAGISAYRARVVILDITGVPVVDTSVANHLSKTTRAARLKGAHTIVTGISDAVAETITDLGVDWSDTETLADLQSGLMEALKRMGMRLTRGDSI